MDAAPEPDYKALYERAVEAIRLGAEAFQQATDVFHKALQDLAALDGAAGKAEGEAGADADEDGDVEAGGPADATRVAPCTTCDDSDDEFCALHDHCRHLADPEACPGCAVHPYGGVRLTHGGSYPCPGPGDCRDFDCPCS